MVDVKLYHGDCLEILPTLAAGSVDAVVTDPPYESEAHTPMKRTRATIEGREDIAIIPFSAMTEELRGNFIIQSCRICNGWIISFCQVEAVGLYANIFGDAWRRAMVWIKPDSAPQFSGDRPAMGYETICTAWTGNGKSIWNGRGTRGILTHLCTNFKHEHPTQKPVSLMIHLLELFTSPGDTVLDPFMGSGSTIVAAIQTGRNAIGIEIDKHYFAIAQKRIEEAQMQMRLPLEY